MDPARNPRSRFRSLTGQLPPAEAVQSPVSEAHECTGRTSTGELDVYPALQQARSDLFGVCVAGTSGHVYTAGDAETEFTIMSVAKPFVFALVCEAARPGERAREDRGERHRPPVQLARGGRAKRRRTHESDGEPRRDRDDEPRSRRDRRGRSGRFIHDGLSRFAGRPLKLDEDGVRLGLGDEPGQPRPRRASSRCPEPDLLAIRRTRSTCTRGRAP